MAKLYFRYGAMGSSKTANAVMVQYNYRERGQQVLMLKPKIENRDGATVVRSRCGLVAQCRYVEELGGIDLTGIDCIIVDECHRSIYNVWNQVLEYFDAFIIGLAQACAAMPGLSRSGTTIATGLLLGNKKAAVAQFSFLMVLAPILGETFLELMKGNLGAQAIGSAPLAAGFVAAFVVGCLACKFMIEIVKRGKLVWFALYCAAAGTVSILSYVL